MTPFARLAALLLLSFGMGLPDPAAAYIGPGAGLGAIAVTVAILLGVLLLIAGLVWYPLKRMLKSRAAARSGTRK
ncbi:hypothetical protein CEW88_14475 [Alloyangia pacifica]|uniref:Uncharacterized protein n=1 Tax=Alloyangia pacifica TaxID=311180 RepID=A0A2U8HGV9_9RHOB|nr:MULTISPECIES: hypothetical protein [Roseobacteraceae]AWI84978.1 hypothetical protein CEW88_14475 [Alloyangia pacifica]NDV48676.1 hypothetical protein [Salipiger sp. PrR003]NDW30764.1 hypothetical protein [Salipiger sp. PrR007]